MQYRPEIDGLRAVAVLPVLLFHAGLSVFSGGYVGVDVFFVISGFLITGLIREDLAQGRFSILGFYERRVRRILPALTFTVLTTSAVAFAVMLPSFLVDYSKSLVSVSTFLSNIYFWRFSGYFDASATLRPMLHTWSLAVEEQFYIFMPIAAFIVYRFFQRAWLWIFAAAALASLALSIVAMQIGPTANFFLLPTRAWELLLGALFASIPARTPRGVIDQVMAAGGLGLILWAVFAYDEATPFPGLTALAPCVGSALIIYFAHPKATFVGQLLSSKPAVWIGLISYSLYLVHWPIAVFWRYITLQEPGVLGALAIIVLSIPLAWASWAFVERPFRKRGGASSLRVVLVGLSALALIGAIGGFGWASNGLPQRFATQPDAPAAADSAQAPISWRNGVCFFEGAPDLSVWSADACAINPGGETPVLLWGDSFAAHYVPGITRAVEGGRLRVYEYTAAGCPPALSYESYARRWCTDFNAHALELVEELGIERVILSARWVDLRRRGLEHLRSTLDALDARGVDVYVIGQSPIFIADVTVIGGRGHDAWTLAMDRSVNDELREIVQASGAHFIDPLAALCEGERCAIRADGQYLYFDYGHFSDLGSTRAAAAYLPLGPLEAERAHGP
jgi:peptidoglycan/LPS O-acetylase OafA/YrhL